MKNRFDSIEAAVTDIRKGRMVIMVDDADRENEGDLVMAAQHVTPAAVNFMAKYGRGLICVPTTSERLQQLGIERMVKQNREVFRTDFQVSVDAAHDIGSGISAADRAKTIEVMASPTALPEDLVQPGHVFPLRAKSGGVLQRAGHTEAAVDLVILAGARPIGVICEIMNDDGTMARLPALMKFAKKHKLKIALGSDPDIKMAKDWDVWGEKTLYGCKYMGMERATFLIDDKGIIRDAWRKVKVPGHVEAVLAAAKSL